MRWSFCRLFGRRKEDRMQDARKQQPPMVPADLTGPESLGDGVGLRPDGGAPAQASAMTATARQAVAAGEAAPSQAAPNQAVGLGKDELDALEAKVMQRFDELEKSLAQWFEAHLVTSTEAICTIVRGGRVKLEEGRRSYSLIKSGG